MSNIVVVGGCIVDLISYVDRFPKPGETMPGNFFCKGFGGKGANQCYMASVLGGATAMIAKLGDDSFGREYLQNYRESNIFCDHVTVTSETHTSAASICVTSAGQNSIIYVPGAINHLTQEDVLKAEDLISTAKVLLCSFEVPLDTLYTALSIARKHKVKTIVNAAPTTNAAYEKIYPLADIVCMNEVEAEDATGILIKEVKDCVPVFEALHAKNCSTIILTLGSKGAVYQNKDEKNYHHVTATEVKAIDSTGAGDAFMGSFAYYVSEYPDLTLETMIQRSCAIATDSVLRKGTQSSFPKKEDLPSDLF